MVGGGGLRPRFQIRLAAEINASESVTKCAVTNADSVGDEGEGGWGGAHEQIGTEITAEAQRFFSRGSPPRAGALRR